MKRNEVEGEGICFDKPIVYVWVNDNPDVGCVLHTECI